MANTPRPPFTSVPAIDVSAIAQPKATIDVPAKAAPAEPVPSTEKVYDPAEAVKNRKPFGGFTKKLEVANEIPGHTLYWINDEGSRVPECLRAGFQFVTSDEVSMANDGVIPLNTDLGDRISRPVGTKGNDAMYAYLMKLPNEFVEQDQQAKDARNEAIAMAIRGGGGRVAGVEVSQDGTTYTPKSVGVSVKTQEKNYHAKGTSLSGMPN